MKNKNVVMHGMVVAAVMPAVALASTLLPCAMSPSMAQTQDRTWTTEEISNAFDEVARNYGAVECAIYTFMVEFGRSPESLIELRESGHLNVVMINPYTGGEVKSLTEEDYPDGDLAGNIWVSTRDNGDETHAEAWYVFRDQDGELLVRSMVKRIYIYHNSVDYDYFFNNDLPREEQFTAVYCRQSIDAIEGFQQKIGRSPENFDEMYELGDVNVHYINPVTGELAIPSEILSAGDFWYEKIGDEGYTVIGWGRERPVFFATTDEDTETAFYEEWPELLATDETGDDTVQREDSPACRKAGSPEFK